MFTGLVEQMATVTSIHQSASGTLLELACDGWDAPIAIGESICTSGCCLTVLSSIQEDTQTLITFDVVPETLRCTSIGSLSVGDKVNLERSLRPNSLMGGHFVQGHIDGVEKLLEIDGLHEGECRLRVEMNCLDRDTIVQKGSITIDGVSLTISKVEEHWFEVALIPTTLSQTTLGLLSCGDKVNIETDILARTVVQVVRSMQND